MQDVIKGIGISFNFLNGQYYPEILRNLTASLNKSNIIVSDLNMNNDLQWWVNPFADYNIDE